MLPGDRVGKHPNPTRAMGSLRGAPGRGAAPAGLGLDSADRCGAPASVSGQGNMPIFPH